MYQPSHEDELERAQKRAELRRLNRLSALKGNLPDRWARQYDDLIEKYGEPEHPDFLTYTATDVVVEDSQELDAGWFSEAELEEVVELCQRAGDSDDISVSSVSQHLSAAVAKEPARFADSAGLFIGVPARPTRGLLRGLRDAASEEMRFDWEQVIELCRYVVEQDYDYAAHDYDWSEVRRGVADLIATGLEKEASSPSYRLRDQVWELLEALVEDDDPPREGGDSRNMEPATEALNTTRGRALHAVFRYCWWVKREIDADNGDEFSFGETAPEAREILEESVDPEVDRALAIRAVFGQWYPSIVGLDRIWAEEHTENIFPQEEELADQWQAAWRSYLVFWPPDRSIYPLVREQYSLSLVRLTGDIEQLSGGTPLRDPEVRLGEHLVALQSWGVLEEEGDEELLRRFWEDADLEARMDVIRSVGGNLMNTEEEIDGSVIGRLQSVWDERLEWAEDDRGSARDELEAFVSWFSADVFDEDWATRRLHRTLQLASRVPDHPMNAIELLSSYSGVSPELRLECLRLFVSGRFGDSLVRIHMDEVRSILEAALGDPSAEVRAKGEDLINQLGRKGIREFRELLEGSD